MKKFLWVLLLVCALPLCALAQDGEAPEITAKCTLKLSICRNLKSNLTDGMMSTMWCGENKGWLEVTTPAGTPCYGMYINWGKVLTEWEIQTQDDNGKWQRFYYTDERYYNQYIPLEGGLTHFRIQSLATGNEPVMTIAEIRLLGEGFIPDWVQLWQPFEGKADIMVLVAHADDELLFMGGTIPYYTAERGKKVIVVYLAYMPSNRNTELLNALWYCGVRGYPELAPRSFKDVSPSTMKSVLTTWGEDKLYARITELIRKYQPDVLVTHDVKGEYGHAAHKAASYAVQRCIEYAAIQAKYPQSAASYGTWQVKKTYLHLLPDNPIRMDWRQPLDAFDGLTAFEVTENAFKMHRSQYAGGKWKVQDDGPYDNSLFGLFFSTVGEDVLRNDFLEHLE